MQGNCGGKRERRTWGRNYLPIHRRRWSNTSALGPLDYSDCASRTHPWQSSRTQTPYRILFGYQFWRLLLQHFGNRKNAQRSASALSIGDSVVALVHRQQSMMIPRLALMLQMLPETFKIESNTSHSI